MSLKREKQRMYHPSLQAQIVLHLAIAASCGGSYVTLKALGLPFDSWNKSDQSCTRALQPWLMVCLCVLFLCNVLEATSMGRQRLSLAGTLSGVFSTSLSLCLFLAGLLLMTRKCFTPPKAFAAHVGWAAVTLTLSLVALLCHPPRNNNIQTLEQFFLAVNEEQGGRRNVHVQTSFLVQTTNKPT